MPIRQTNVCKAVCIMLILEIHVQAYNDCRDPNISNKEAVINTISVILYTADNITSILKSTDING